MCLVRLCSLKSQPLQLLRFTNLTTTRRTYFTIDTFVDRCCFNVDHFEKACYYNDGNAGGSDFSDDYFEDCHFTNGHQEDSCLNDGQGVYKTPGAYLEAPTIIAGKRSGPSLGSRRNYAHSRTGAKDGLSAPPKVQIYNQA